MRGLVVKPIWLLMTDMDGTTGLVALQIRKIERFRHQTLAGECCITMQQQGHDLFTVAVVFLTLLGADLAETNRIHALQMRRVRGQRQVH